MVAANDDPHRRLRDTHRKRRGIFIFIPEEYDETLERRVTRNTYASGYIWRKELTFTNNVFQIANVSLLHFLNQAANNCFGDCWAFINHAGINLNQARAGGKFFPRIIGIENSADADNRQLSVRLFENMADDFRAASAQRLAAQAAGFGINFL